MKNQLIELSKKYSKESAALHDKCLKMSATHKPEAVQEYHKKNKAEISAFYRIMLGDLRDALVKEQEKNAARKNLVNNEGGAYDMAYTAAQSLLNRNLDYKSILSEIEKAKAQGRSTFAAILIEHLESYRNPELTAVESIELKNTLAKLRDPQAEEERIKDAQMSGYINDVTNMLEDINSGVEAIFPPSLYGELDDEGRAIADESISQVATFNTTRAVAYKRVIREGY